MASPGSQMEYQHFIPQFILRNFSHKFQSSSKSRRRKKDKKTNLYPNDLALNIIDLKSDPPEIRETPVKRTFGMMDMYKDITNVKSHNFLEKEIGKLESRVSTIIAGLKKAFEAGQSGYSMMRSERDTLRKFLFLMKYRGPDYHRRFHGGESGAYIEDDAQPFRAYMLKKGFEDPKSVWFEAIKAILELKMDVGRKWIEKLRGDIYSDDAEWFIMHTEAYFMAICTPEDPNDEFFLTENCFHVCEGPHSLTLNQETGKMEVRAWSSYHEFGPIAPKLLLVLRSFVLPYPEEDINDEIREWRQRWFERQASLHIDPTAADSILKDLPITKARNSYTQTTANGRVLLSGEDGSRRPTHHFTFPFFKISNDHVRKIHSVLFENAYRTNTIAFTSEFSLKDHLKYYIQLPGDSGFKNVSGEDDVRLIYLKKLRSTLASMGVCVDLSYQNAFDVAVRAKAARGLELRMLEASILKSMPEQLSDFEQLCSKLGGSRNTLFSDMNQAGKMRFLRIKIDVWSKGLPEDVRQRIRDDLRDIFCQLRPVRVWMYLKSLRAMSFTLPGDPEDVKDDYMSGPEDVIAKVCHIVKPGRLGLLLHHTVMQDIENKKHPDLNPGAKCPKNMMGVLIAQRIKNLTFNHAGELCNCGIKIIEAAALKISLELRRTENRGNYTNPLWNLNQNIEVLTRTLVRQHIHAILSKKLSKMHIQELSDVLFNIVYPSYPLSMFDSKPIH